MPEQTNPITAKAQFLTDKLNPGETNAGQFTDTSYEGRARAVRRLVIQ